ncbi:MAG TPA: hypothetical protein VFQ35_08220 [Polyangiaceae bacterium]|nr:hypothetical protein [Polyangiaceae bacterium]
MLIVLLALAQVRCEDVPKERTLALTTHAPAGCERRPSPGDASLRLTPLGDFALPAASEVLLDTAKSLDFPEQTRAVVAEARTSDGVFVGYAARGAKPSLDVLLWPDEAACRLDVDPGAAPNPGGGQALGVSADATLALIVGGNSPKLPAGSVAATIFDTGSGEVTALSSSGEPRTALAEPRAFATVTPFGTQMLVAGGEDPLNSDGNGLAPPSKTAEVFDPERRRFGSALTLTVARSRHAAVALAGGQTLLIGGRGPSGNALNALEVLAPGDTHGSIQGLAALTYPRLFPTAALLDDGRIFVGGGVTALGTPLSALEWLSSNAKQILRADLPEQLPPRFDRAFAALPGGGVLAVGGCQPSEDPCTDVCRSGCPPRDAGDDRVRYDAWWIAPDGALTRVPLDIDAPRPVLLGGGDGRPMLASGAPGDTKLYRFDPWQARFVEGPFSVSAPPVAGLPATAPDDGAFLWLSEDGVGAQLSGARLSTRNRFAIDENLLGAPSDDVAAPYPLVPDRPALSKTRFDDSVNTLFFEEGSDVGVFVAASDYANVTVELTVEGDAPKVVLGTREYGGDDCPWPIGAVAQFRLERRGERVTLGSAGTSAPSCDAPRGRVRLGVKRGRGAMGVRYFRVTREPE